jgi:3-oxoacyl-[acyl-carrier protein] reductase
MDLGISGKTALVTGSSRGIGKAAALQLAREGVRVVITYREQQEKAEAVAQEIRANSGEAMVVALDLQSSASIRQAVEQVNKNWGTIDILINNAVQWGKRAPWDALLFENEPEEEWREEIRTNLEGSFAVLQAVVPGMRSQGWGRIVNVSSGIAVDGLPGKSAYGAAKAALHGLTRTLHKELGPHGILINVVMPGMTITERSVRLPETVLQKFAQSSPIGRLLPSEEVVPVMLFLCSALNTAVTGEMVRASGGIT